MKERSTQQEFMEALDALIERVKEDRSVLAAILCGSLSHDTVWATEEPGAGILHAWIFAGAAGRLAALR